MSNEDPQKEAFNYYDISKSAQKAKADLLSTEENNYFVPLKSCRERVFQKTGTDISDQQLLYIVTERKVKKTRVKGEEFLDLVHFYGELDAYYAEASAKAFLRSEASKAFSAKYQDFIRFAVRYLGAQARREDSALASQLVADYLKYTGTNISVEELLELTLKYGRVTETYLVMYSSEITKRVRYQAQGGVTYKALQGKAL